jgi:hypothetical protein
VRQPVPRLRFEHPTSEYNLEVSSLEPPFLMMRSTNALSPLLYAILLKKNYRNKSVFEVEFQQ